MYFILVAQPKVFVGWLSLHPRCVTTIYCLEVRLEDKEDETNLGVAHALQYKVNRELVQSRPIIMKPLLHVNNSQKWPRTL